jgi:cytosine/adenosine deaminase-related metal-dependent hydrolase
MTVEAIYSASWLINPDAPPVSGGALFIRDGIIADMGTLSELRSRHAAPQHDYPGCAILPGFVNAHTHLELTHFPSWRLHSALDYHPRRFTDWIIQLIKILRGVSADAYPSSVREGVRMCLESGTTAVGEILTNPLLAELYRCSPLAGRLYFELLGQDDAHFHGRLSGALAALVGDDTAATFQNGLSPHSPYTLNPAYFSAIRETADTRRLPLAIHLAESQAEVDLFHDGSGDFATEFYPFVGWQRFLDDPPRCSATELFDQKGLITAATALIHAVHVSRADVELIKARGARVVLCPRSNELLDVGRAPVALFKECAISLALGTDSLASNNSLSLWDEARFALEAFSGQLDEHDLFCMVTTGGAAALGMTDQCGVLAVGRRADFQVVAGGTDATATVLQRLMREGKVREVFVAGSSYGGAA